MNNLAGTILFMKNRLVGSPWMLGITFVGIYLFNFFLAWPTTRWGDISNGSFLFGDFSALSTWSSECRVNVALPDLFSVYSQIDSSATCPGFNYGMTLIILLSIFPIAWEYYVVTALTVGVLAVLALGHFLASNYKMGFWQKVIVALAFFSPGTYLLFERGNLDLVIFLLIVMAASLLARGSFLPGFFVLVFATLLKFYALPAVVLAALLAKKISHKIVVSLLTLATIAWVLFDFSRSQVLSSYGPVQFGYPVLGHYFEWLGLSLDPVPNMIGFLTPFIVWAALVLIERKAGPVYQSQLSKTINDLKGDYAFIFTALLFCAMFFIGLSFDYRLIFLALAGVALILKCNLSRELRIALWVSLFIALWGSGAIGGNFMFIPPAIKPVLIGGFQLAGDLAVFLWVGILLYVGALVLARKIDWFSRLLFFITRSKVVG
jgi:hypothetical protein